MHIRCCFRFRFKDVYYDTDQMFYSYNPCGGFTEGDCSEAAVSTMNLVCLFDLILYVPSTIFQLNRDGSSWVKQYC